MQRWILVIALTALLGLLVAACGSNDSDNGDSGDNSAKSTTGGTGATGDTAATANETTGATEPGTGSAVTAGTDPVAEGRLFSADSPWNTTAEGLPIDDASDRMLELAQFRRAAKEVPGQEGVQTFTRDRRRRHLRQLAGLGSPDRRSQHPGFGQHQVRLPSVEVQLG